MKFKQSVLFFMLHATNKQILPIQTVKILLQDLNTRFQAPVSVTVLED